MKVGGPPPAGRDTGLGGGLPEWSVCDGKRPSYRGGYGPKKKGVPMEPCVEPLFLSDNGYAPRRNGWNIMAQRLRRILSRRRRIPTASAATDRGTGIREAGWTDSDLMEPLGWKSQAMLRRYIGRVSIAHLKQLPEPKDSKAVSRKPCVFKT